MIPIRDWGRSGVRASILGFGVSGPHGGLAPSSLTERLIRQALSEGVTLFDTAPFYGDAEARLGRALVGVSDVAVLTKVGTKRRGLRLVKDFGIASIRTSVEHSLRRLRRARLDVVLLHGPPPTLLDDDALTKLVYDLKRDGLVRSFGVCGRGADVSAFAALDWIDVVEAPLDCIEVPRECNRPFLAIEVLRGAARPKLAPPSLGDTWRFAKAVLEQTRRCEASEVPRVDARRALSSAWATPGVTAVLATTTRAAHLAANIEAARAWAASAD